jgi:SOS-response transcriptional repressor LexA
MRENRITDFSMAKLYSEALLWLEKEAERKHGGKNRAWQVLGAKKATYYKALSRNAIPNAKEFLRWLELEGAKLTFPDKQSDTSRQVRFVSPHMVPVNGEAAPPVPDDYIAVPLAKGGVAAGRGLVPKDEIQDWVLVARNQDSIRFRTNLIAVRIDRGMDSMAPTLHPGDIVLVDKDDFKDKFEAPGNIFLIREPDDSVAVKRVVIEGKNGDTVLTFYSDNVTQYPPRNYSLAADYGGDISRAIVGRCVWSWADMRKK